MLDRSEEERELREVLLVEDNRIDAQLIRRLLRRVSASYYRITHVRTLNDAVLSADELTPDVILADLNLPDSRGTDTVASLQTAYPDIPLIIVSAWEDEAVSLRSVKAGAQDYLVKGHIDGANLHRVIRYAIERKRTELELVRLAQFDQLTGLPNRTLLRERVNHALARAMRSGSGVATLILDMDRFKEINDMLGHEVGDKLLIKAAKRIRANVRDQDTVARLGGDEFAVVLEGVSEAKEVLPVIERIVESLREVTAVDGHEVNTSTSIGIAMYPENGSNLSELLRAADLAMYQAKSSGRACYQFFADAMQEEAQSRRALEWALRHAVEENEFQLVYQPQICLRTGGVIGVEALIRWMHPTRGLLTPYHFIGALEEFGLINEVGGWVLQTACEQMRRWQALELQPMRMSVNVSAQQFEDPLLIDKVRSALAKTELAPELLELELTESCLMSDPAQAGALLRQIRDIGVRIAIDDFGTGYSSLTYLNEFPLNALKIDKSFVQSVESTDRGGPISNMIIGLGKNLGLQVIAEGVETPAQLAYMQEHGCDIAQGYLYSRPESPEDLTPWLMANQRTSGTYMRSISMKRLGDGTKG
ncbi:MAG: EAL domain-containing protein [Deltaproteobacteria bacterium]|nr:EAL domain-containing protein [Deltaproteobacteria bacterium]NND28795.1 EAL domain-containing protein [Myxococcales bacterium]MBT8466754.1 EAL domain-containing protein [Deltaproteobacteria bacterium]MBT8483765.1 EAL domain-containing protein [Deltaproteobacteria bacterium]NNK07351.1 EAL domain-containing protein [Myxococcales bacterium]